MSATAPQRYSDHTAATTLNGAINNSQTTLTLTSATGLPTAYPFTIKIEAEEIEITSANGAAPAYNCVRAKGGTTGASHADTTSVRHVLTKRTWDQRFTDNITKGLYADAPTNERAGKLYLPTDSPIMMYDDGSAWSNRGPSEIWKPIDVSLFTLRNCTGADGFTQYGPRAIFASKTSGAGLRIGDIALPSLPFTVTARLRPIIPFNADANQYGLCLVDIATPKVVLHCQYQGPSNWAGYTSHILYNSGYTTQTSASQDHTSPTFAYQWFRIAVTGGGSAAYQWSGDGVFWHGVITENYNLSITPTRLGIFCKNYGNSNQYGCIIDSWEVS